MTKLEKAIIITLLILFILLGIAFASGYMLGWTDNPQLGPGI